jgi:hypothetical protein
VIFRNQPPRIVVDAQVIAGHRPLRAAIDLGYALDAGRGPWEFAVEIAGLIGLGLTTSDLRWLVSKGYLQYARETTRQGDGCRRFRPCLHLAFDKRACFILTEAGMRLKAPSVPPLAVSDEEPSVRAGLQAAPTAGAAILPSWDGLRRTLRVGDRVVKRFRVPSPCQEAILAAFQEEGWPAAIDDPLPPQPVQDPKRRLRETVRSLNANQANPILRFRGDGTGTRVVWERREAAKSPGVLRVRRSHAA